MRISEPRQPSDYISIRGIPPELYPYTSQSHLLTTPPHLPPSLPLSTLPLLLLTQSPLYPYPLSTCQPPPLPMHSPPHPLHIPAHSIRTLPTSIPLNPNPLPITSYQSLTHNTCGQEFWSF